MNKHAYLIMAHGQFGLLKTLIELLDSKHNDIFIHIDKKAKEFALEDFSNLTKHSKVIFVERKKIKWGCYSIVDAELQLMKTALKTDKYSYFHLLSGQDLPIKNIEDIYNFFENQGKDYITWEDNPTVYMRRFRTFRHLISANKFCAWLSHLIYLFQYYILRIDRTKKSGLAYQKGSQWFSITAPLCKYIIDQEAFIKQWFDKTECPDESVMQTIALNSPYKDNLVNENKRLIIWQDNYVNHPKTFTIKDKDVLQQSNKLFARKFNEKQSKELVDVIKQMQ